MSKNNIYGFIPARMESTRFPGKPLYPISGIPMLGHVIKRAQMYSDWSDLFVATCDEEIDSYVKSLGVKVIMTSDKHTRSLDRIAEAVELCGHNVQNDDIILNVQGDYPMIRPDMIEATVEPILIDQEVKGTMLAMPVVNEEQYYDPNAMKIVHNLKGDVLYTSRSPVPYSRVFSPEIGAKCIHGLFGFRWAFLKIFNELPNSPLELSESCDSNRLYDYGYTQRIALYPIVKSYSVDVIEDITTVEKSLKDDKLFNKYK